MSAQQLNVSEAKVVKVIVEAGEPIGIRDIAKKAFPRVSPAAQADSQVRNALRRPVAFGWIKRVGEGLKPGVYKVDGRSLEKIKAAVADPRESRKAKADKPAKKSKADKPAKKSKTEKKVKKAAKANDKPKAEKSAKVKAEKPAKAEKSAKVKAEKPAKAKAEKADKPAKVAKPKKSKAKPVSKEPESVPELVDPPTVDEFTATP